MVALHKALVALPPSALENGFFDTLGSFPSGSLTVCDALSFPVEDINCIFKYSQGRSPEIKPLEKEAPMGVQHFPLILGHKAALALAQLLGDSFEQRVTQISVLSACLRLGIFFTMTPPKKYTIWRTSAKYLRST